MKKNFLFLSILFALTIYSGCSNSKNKATAEANKNNASAALATSENGLSETDQIAFVSGQTSNLNGEARVGAYNSQITVSFDGSGNKIENRYFENHPRLAFLLVTTHVKGAQQVTVFGKGGQNRTIPIDKFNDIMSASPDEIADVAGILEPVKPVAPMSLEPIVEPVQVQNSSVPVTPPDPQTPETTVAETVKTLPDAETKPTPLQQARQANEESADKDNLKQ